jgi:hypothetical protein
LTLLQRSKMFHRQFPEAKVSPSTLARVYKAHKISYKKVKRVKMNIDSSAEPHRTNMKTILDQLYRCETEGIRVVYVDEAVFTFNTFQARAWAPKKANIEVLEKLFSFKAQSLIAGVSVDKGFDHYAIHPRSIKIKEFIQFLEVLSA